MQYPNDSEATRTEYTYDSMYRQAAAACETDTGLELSANYTFDGDYLTTIETPTTTYHFAYGTFGLRQSVTAGDQVLVNYSYNGDWDLQRRTYGNGDYIGYTYDDKGRPTVETHVDMSGVGDTATQVDSFTVEYFYDNDGNLASVRDGATGITTTQYYDLLGRPMKYVENNGTKDIHSVEYDYNGDNNLETLTEKIGNTELLTEYAYDDDNRVTSVTTDGTTVEYTYDSYGRVSKQVTKNGETAILTESFTYTGDTTAKTTSSQIATYTTTAGGNTVTYSYEYDDNGNITSVVSTTSNSDGTNSTSYTTTYEYDSANQLIRENNQAGNFTHTWTYDNAGNILERKEYAYTTGTLDANSGAAVLYTYGETDETTTETEEDTYNEAWGDLLRSYSTQAITYDRIGNPETFGSRTYTWEYGRQLKSLTEGSTTWNYTYDAGGLRTGRTNGTSGGTYAYTYTGSQLIQMKKGTSNTLTFTYDASGTPLTVTWNGTKYYYTTNIQGDVVAILNADGTTAASYTYDAWGKCLNSYTSGIGFLNPLRYRGYVYDQQTELYYLQSRYYDPKVGRFVNADIFTTTGQGFIGNNMFAYCLNNPICLADDVGTDAIYVVDFNKESGLPIVGHAYVYLQDTDGTWYITQFTGDFPDKTTATISCQKVGDQTEISDMLANKKIKNKDYSLLAGDFSESLVYAQENEGTNYGGYHLTYNNCLHYARNVLLQGAFDSQIEWAGLERYHEYIPAGLTPVFKQAKRMAKIGGFFKDVWKKITDLF